MNTPTNYNAFSDNIFLVSGQLIELAMKIKGISETAENILILNDQTGQQVNLNLSGSTQDIQQRYAEPKTVKKVERPKLTVISREITLQKKHWDWLDLL
ncbi:MAG: DUF2239 family protein [Chryseobacterium sp.]